jgi:hypothetical protein
MRVQSVKWCIAYRPTRSHNEIAAAFLSSARASQWTAIVGRLSACAGAPNVQFERSHERIVHQALSGTTSHLTLLPSCRELINKVERNLHNLQREEISVFGFLSARTVRRLFGSDKWMSLSPLIQAARKFLSKLVPRLTEVSFFIHLLFLASTGSSLNHDSELGA